MRAAYLCRGVALPPRGSVSERVMFEMYKREELNKLAEWEATMLVTAAFFGFGGETSYKVVSRMKQELATHLNHEAYNAESIVNQLYGKLAAIQKDRQVIERLESMTVI